MRFENTLASVLQNRPKDCEVLVVQPRPYADPYGLGGEVRFVEAPATASLVDLINRGLHAASGSVVHLLSCDVEVLDGWTDHVLPWFDDPAIGAVSPLIVHPDRTGVVARGVQFGTGGTRRVVRGSTWPRRSTTGLLAGPTIAAGFYRRQAVVDAGGFDAHVGPLAADVDLGLSLRRSGLQVVHVPESMVIAQHVPGRAPLSLRDGRALERLFWRNVPQGRWKRSLILHGLAIAHELLVNACRAAVLPHMLGRILGTLDLASSLGHRRKWAATSLPLPTTTDEERAVIEFPAAAPSPEHVSRRARSAA